MLTKVIVAFLDASATLLSAENCLMSSGRLVQQTSAPASFSVIQTLNVPENSVLH